VLVASLTISGSGQSPRPESVRGHQAKAKHASGRCEQGEAGRTRAKGRDGKRRESRTWKLGNLRNGKKVPVRRSIYYASSSWHLRALLTGEGGESSGSVGRVMRCVEGAARRWSCSWERPVIACALSVRGQKDRLCACEKGREHVGGASEGWAGPREVGDDRARDGEAGRGGVGCVGATRSDVVVARIAHLRVVSSKVFRHSVWVPAEVMGPQLMCKLTFLPRDVKK
jgi:hypothetical protein